MPSWPFLSSFTSQDAWSLWRRSCHFLSLVDSCCVLVSLMRLSLHSATKRCLCFFTVKKEICQLYWAFAPLLFCAAAWVLSLKNPHWIFESNQSCDHSARCIFFHLAHDGHVQLIRSWSQRDCSSLAIPSCLRISWAFFWKMKSVIFHYCFFFSRLLFLSNPTGSLDNILHVLCVTRNGTNIIPHQLL